MNNFFTIYSYELKKILSKRSFQIMFVLGLAVMVLLSVTDSDYARGRTTLTGRISASEFTKITQEKSRKVNGHKIDDQLLAEMRYDIYNEAVNSGYVTWDDINAFLYDTSTEHYVNLPTGEKCTMFRALQYAAISTGWYDVFSCIYDRSGYVDQAPFLASSADLEGLDTYYFTPTYDAMAGTVFMFGWVLLLLLATWLSGTFADERNLGSDALIRSTKTGMKNICFCKMSAGITVSVVTALVFTLVSFGVCGLFFGFDGADAPIQSLIGDCEFDLTLSHASLEMLGIIVLAAATFGAGTMLLSELLSSPQTISIRALVLIASIFNIPVASIRKYWSLRPVSVIMADSFANHSTYKILGLTLDYLDAGVLLMAVLFIIYSTLTIIHYRKTSI